MNHLHWSHRRSGDQIPTPTSHDTGVEALGFPKMGDLHKIHGKQYYTSRKN